MSKPLTEEEFQHRRELADILEKTAWSITNNLCADIKSGKIPKDWDMRQLLPLLARRIASRAIPMNRKQKREYGNDIIICNL
jgi:hypothetical protein